MRALGRFSRKAAPPGSRRRKWVFGAAMLAAAAAMAFFVVGAGAVTGSPSSFESGDGNMVLNTSGNTDWNCFVNSDSFAHNGSTPAGCAVTSGASQVTADQSAETAWVNGQKFDTQCPALSVNNNPPKDEFTNVASFNETASNLDVFFYGATIRPNVNGNSSGNVELNQAASSSPTTTSGCRTAGDRLVAYNFLNGGTTLDFHVLTWIDSAHPNLGGNTWHLLRQDRPAAVLGRCGPDARCLTVRRPGKPGPDHGCEQWHQ